MTEPSDRVKARVERGLGWLGARWRPGPSGGLTRSSRWLVDGSGETVFVKIGRDAVSNCAVRAEIDVFREVSGPFMPALLGWDRGNPPFLVLEDLSGALWPPPYPADLDPLFETLAAIAAAPAPPKIRPLVRLPPRWPRLAGQLSAALAPEAAGWVRSRLGLLTSAEQRIDPTGDRLVHLDVWAPNLCFAARGAVLVDWTDTRRGNPDVDVAYAMLDLRRHGRRPPSGLLDDEPAWASHVVAAMIEGLVVDLPWAADVDQARATFVGYLTPALEWARELFD